MDCTQCVSDNKPYLFTSGRIRTGGFPIPLLSLLFTLLPLQPRLLTPPTVKDSYIIYCLTLTITVWL